MKLKKIKRMVAVGTAILMTLSLAGCGIGSDSVKAADTMRSPTHLRR